MASNIQEVFLQLVRLGIGCEAEASLPVSAPLSVEDWQALEELANEHGLLGVMLDGVEKLPRELRPEKKAIIQSIGQLIQSEQQYAVQEHAATEMALLLHQHGIRTYVLKGAVVAECYPKPEHRRSVDMDCFLANENADVLETCGTSEQARANDNEDVWERGNRVLEELGFEVRRDFYKNSTVVLPGLTVENHRYLTPFRGNKRLKNLERFLQSMMFNDNDNLNDNENGGGKEVWVSVNVKVESSSERRFEGTWLYRPPVMVSALFLIEHAYSHFLHEGLTWRHVLDWTMFSRWHREEIDWVAFDSLIDEYGFRKFYDSYSRLGRFFVGELSAGCLQLADQWMLEDIWAPLDVHETVTGLRGKLALAGNTWRARWKYRHFTDMTWLRALWIQAKGVLFKEEPKLE